MFRCASNPHTYLRSTAYKRLKKGKGGVGDCLTFVFGARDLRMVRMNNRLMSGMQVMEFFFTNEWRWGIENAILLQQSLTADDQAVRD